MVQAQGSRDFSLQFSLRHAPRRTVKVLLRIDYISEIERDTMTLHRYAPIIESPRLQRLSFDPWYFKTRPEIFMNGPGPVKRKDIFVPHFLV